MFIASALLHRRRRPQSDSTTKRKIHQSIILRTTLHRIWIKFAQIHGKYAEFEM